MKNNLCLFERPLKIQKNGVFLSEIFFFRFRDIDVFLLCKLDQWWRHCLQLKSGKYWINDICGNIEAVFLKLGTTNAHQKRNKLAPLVPLPWQQFCHWCCVNKNRNSLFCLKTRTIYPSQSNDGNEDNMGTMSARSRTLWLTLEISDGDIYFFDRKRLEPKRLLW